MRVLHLFSNCKWTGPAEPALNLCCALRDEGVDVEFACAPDAGYSVNMVVETARARGFAPILDLHLRKHRHPFKNLHDVKRLRTLVRERGFDIVHCHLDNDHAIAARALRGIQIPIVRSSYEGLGLKGDRRHQRMLDKTALLIEPSMIARDHDIETFGLDPGRVTVVPGAIDTQRFDPTRPLDLGSGVAQGEHRVAQVEDAPGRASRDENRVARASRLCNSAERREEDESPTRQDTSAQNKVAQGENRVAQASRLCPSAERREADESPARQDTSAQNRAAQGEHRVAQASRLCPSAERREPQNLRARWGIPEDAYVVGIVARMQTHRHFEDLLAAMRQLIDVMPNAHLLIVGRGTNQKIVVEDPARDLGMADHVHITGYLEGDELVAAIQAFGVGTYLVPGSDGTCRAAREILSMGKPMVVADRGMLREIVADGESGVVCDGSPEALFAALRDFGQDGERRRAMGEAARRIAEERFALAAQARAVKALYEGVLG